MKREPGSEEYWSSVIERLYGAARANQPGLVAVDAAALELVCRIARRGVKGYRP